MTDDMALVREYAASQSEHAFEQRVARHLDLVHSAALRREDSGDVRMVGRNVSLSQVELPAGAPANRYDFLVTVTGRPVEWLCAAVKQQLGYAAHMQEREAEVLLLKVAVPNASGLRPSTDAGRSGSTYKAGKFQLRHARIGQLPHMIEEVHKRPLRDQTGLGDFYDFELEWRRRGGDEPMDLESLRRSLSAMGLALVPGKETLPMMVVERVKS